jgi:hypothetical protein
MFFKCRLAEFRKQMAYQNSGSWPKNLLQKPLKSNKAGRVSSANRAWLLKDSGGLAFSFADFELSPKRDLFSHPSGQIGSPAKLSPAVRESKKQNSLTTCERICQTCLAGILFRIAGRT